MIQADLTKQVIGLGDGGVAVTLNGTAKIRGEALLKQISLNEELSEQLSYNRRLEDFRNRFCLIRKYDLVNMPTTSVVIIYYNEPYSVILRTVHSVLRTTNEHILKEIILVDDGSTHIELKGKLNYYIETRFPKNVKIITLKQRLGLVRARLIGARAASSDILVFLDAHCECNIEWLEPLADRIRESRKSVLVPIIDKIGANNFEYSGRSQIFSIGGFVWNGHFMWIDVPQFEMERIHRECDYLPEICPTRSPTMAGGLFAIDREYFWESGSYDEKMDGWGGENLEMSFRIWQCGGTIETIPCSRIGHIFRANFQEINRTQTHSINTVRMARVWMDEYIELLFMNRPHLKYYNDFGDVSERIMLRENLKCNNFSWFLKNVFPQKFVPTENVQGYGQFRSQYLCLDDLQQQTDFLGYKIGVYECNNAITNSQFFSLTNAGVIRRELFCAVVKHESTAKYYVKMVLCTQGIEEYWSYTSQKHLKHFKTGLCLDTDELQVNDYVQLKICDIKSDTQKWLIVHNRKKRSKYIKKNHIIPYTNF